MFKILFDAGEHSCFADSPKGTEVLPLSSFDKRRHSFFSINPIDGRRDHKPTAPYHHAGRPRRADVNVTSYRNILVEMDRLPLADQWDHVKALQMPFSSCVYSGGKSYHFIISLSDTLSSRAAYDALVKRLYSVLGSHVDPSCKNPSRLSRSPGHLRRETFKFQDLKELRERVSNQEFEEWLNRNNAAELEPKKIVAQNTLASLVSMASHQPGDFAFLYRSSEEFLRQGAPDGEWNQRLFKAACDAFSKDWDLETFVLKAKAITGHLDQKDQSTIMSAYQRAARKPA